MKNQWIRKEESKFFETNENEDIPKPTEYRNSSTKRKVYSNQQPHQKLNYLHPLHLKGLEKQEPDSKLIENDKDQSRSK